MLSFYLLIICEWIFPDISLLFHLNFLLCFGKVIPGKLYSFKKVRLRHESAEGFNVY